MPLKGALLKRAADLNERLNKNKQPKLDFVLYQEKTLRRLLKKAQHTAFGKHYNFKGLLQANHLTKSFSDALPFSDYDKMYKDWWYRILEGKEENVTWRGKIKHFALSSGTTGSSSKYIPVSNDMIRSIRSAGLKIFFCISKFDNGIELFDKDMMMLGGSIDLEKQEDYYVGDLSGINLKKRPFWLRGNSKPGNDILKIKNWDDKIAEIAKNAPKWDVGYIMGIPAWNQLMMERIIEYNKVDSIHDIWPNLGVFIHGGVAFEPYRKSFEKLMSKPMSYMDTYLASEGFMAFQNRPDTQSMAMLLSNGIYYEFVPFNDKNFVNGVLQDDADVYNIGQVKEGVDYALLISTCSGAWRYLIGDTVKFTDLSKAEIVITGRTKQFLSICGEHLSVDNMNQGISTIQEQLGITIPEYTVSGVRSGNFFAHKWYIGTDDKLDVRTIEKLLDDNLKRLNDDYATERSSVLGIDVEIIPSQVFYDWHRSKGSVGGQSKFPRVMRGEQWENWKNFVNAHQQNA